MFSLYYLILSQQCCELLNSNCSDSVESVEDLVQASSKFVIPIWVQPNTFCDALSLVTDVMLSASLYRIPLDAHYRIELKHICCQLMNFSYALHFV